MGFNRYMVECKYGNSSSDKNNSSVLIDTWWNVNISDDLIRYFFLTVLIDTWWNVNKRVTKKRLKEIQGFNRYMVECKLTLVYMQQNNQWF